MALRVTAKSLDAFLKARLHTSLSVATYALGQDMKPATGEYVDERLLGRIARRYGMTPEILAYWAEQYV